MGRVDTANEFFPAKQMLVSQFFDILTSNFPCPGIKHAIQNSPVPKQHKHILFCLNSLIFYFSHCHAVRTMIIQQRFLGWHLLLEAPLLLPQAMEMDRDPMSITACTSPHHLNNEFLS